MIQEDKAGAKTMGQLTECFISHEGFEAVAKSQTSAAKRVA